MACTGVPHIVLHVLCSTRTSGGYYKPSEIRFEGILALYLHKRNRRKGPKIPLNLTSEGLKYPLEVRVEHKTCSTICGTPVQAIFDQKNLTHLGASRRLRGQKYIKARPILGHILTFFDPPLPTRSIFFGPK